MLGSSIRIGGLKMAEKNKVQFNLKNTHYAPYSIVDGVVKFETPVAIPGSVNLTLDQQGSVTPFYADGIVYYQAVANNGYAGDLEVARYPDQMLVDIWGFELNTDKVLVENSNVEPKPFALLYQIDGDVNEDFYCLYNCTGTRPGIGSSTNTDTKTPQTRTSTISAVPLADGRVMARTTEETADNIKAEWFKSVYDKSVEATGEEATGEEATAE